MNTDFGIRINTTGSGSQGHDQHSGSRRQQHQQKLRALISALDLGNLDKARQAYAALLEFSPALEHSHFSRIGQALASANLAVARRVIEEIYGQSQAIFRRPVIDQRGSTPDTSSKALPAHALPAHAISAARPQVGVLADYTA